MKLRIFGINDIINIDDRYSTKLIIKNLELFRKIVSILTSGDIINDNEVVLVYDEKQLRIKERVICLTDYFHYEEWFKLLVSKVYKEVEIIVQCDSSLQESFELTSSSFKNFIDNVMMDYDFEIYALKTPKLSSFLKIYNYFLISEGLKDVKEKFYYLLDMICHFYMNNLLVLVNVSNVFDEKELNELVNYLLYKKIHFLFIESQNNDILKTEQVYEIDNDYVLFTYTE